MKNKSTESSTASFLTVLYTFYKPSDIRFTNTISSLLFHWNPFLQQIYQETIDKMILTVMSSICLILARSLARIDSKDADLVHMRELSDNQYSH